MEYLIIEYRDRGDDPISQTQILGETLMDEEEMWKFLQDHREDKKFTVNKVECILDYS